MEASGHRARGASLSGIGGVDSGADAAEFILLGSDTVQARPGAGAEGRGPNGCAALVGTQATPKGGGDKTPGA
jgi:dihydroorotate dehydrogenase